MSQPGDDPVSVQWAAKMSSAWAEFLATVLESMTGQRPSITVEPAAPDTSYHDLVWWAQDFSVPEHSTVWLGASKEVWAGIGRVTLSALGVEEPSESDLESTFRDVMAQTTGMVASRLTQQSGKEITAGPANSASAPDESHVRYFAWTLTTDAGPLKGLVSWSANFVRFCARLAEAEIAAGSETASTTSVEPDEQAGKSGASLPRIDLTVKFVLGRTSLSLRNIFKLNIGSVLELDRTASDPAEVIVHGRVLARGQVVVVNGSYGLKILPPKAANRAGE